MSEIDLTDLTAHPDWPRLARLLRLLEEQQISILRAQEDKYAHQLLMALSRVKTEIAMRSRNPHVWKETDSA